MVPQDIMVYWNIPYGEDGRKPVQDLLWYPGQFPVQSWFSPHWNNWNQKQDFEFKDFNYIILNFVKNPLPALSRFLDKPDLARLDLCRPDLASRALLAKRASRPVQGLENPFPTSTEKSENIENRTWIILMGHCLIYLENSDFHFLNLDLKIVINI
jgi:hypothetical protein